MAADDAPVSGSRDYAELPAEILQLVGQHLSPPQSLRAARLVCTPWATALAHCMPAVTVALPRQASGNIFRQPLVLCSSGVLNSAQCQDYAAVPHAAAAAAQPGSNSRHVRRSATGHGAPPSAPLSATRSVGGRAGSSGGHAIDSSSSSSAAVACMDTQPPPCTTVECVSKDKPSPFATEMGQAVLDLQDPLLLAAATGPAAAAVAAAAPAAASGTRVPPMPLVRRPSRLNPPRGDLIHGAISMPPGLADAALATPQQQQEVLALQQQQAEMRKLSSVPATNRPHISSGSQRGTHQGPAEQQQQQHMVTAASLAPMLQGWSSLPSAGLRTVSSLQALHLKLSGAPPSPEDLLDLSRLMHLTHLSFRQVDLPDAEDAAAMQPVADARRRTSPGQLSPCLSAGGASGGCSRSSSDAAAAVRPTKSLDYAALAQVTAAALGRMSMDLDDLQEPAAGRSSNGGAGSSARASRQQHQVGAQQGCQAVPWRSRPGGVSRRAASGKPGGTPWAIAPAPVGSSRDVAASADQRHRADDCESCDGTGDDMDEAAGQEQMAFCSVVTASHVAALARLPYLASLELAPQAGAWDAAGHEGLAALSTLSALTRLSITWGDASAAYKPLGSAEAAAAVRGEQLPLQRCLVPLTQLQELAICGAAVLDVAVLQRMQGLRRLTADALQVVDSDLMAFLQQEEELGQQEGTGRDGPQQQGQQQQQQQQQVALPLLGDAPLAPAPAAAAAGQAPAAQQQQRRRWASLPALEHVHIVHPASDISHLLAGTLTPALTHLGFVSRGPSDFARLLGQHGKLRVLTLVFAEEESWHPIAVVRLPAALPSLRSLTLEGAFWLPNSLIVALGVMEVPLEHLSLTCRLAEPCLQRLQHLKQLKRLALHHVAGGGGAAPAATQPTQKQKRGVVLGAGDGGGMLQLPAKLLPPQLQVLEISNGWILH